MHLRSDGYEHLPFYSPVNAVGSPCCSLSGRRATTIIDSLLLLCFGVGLAPVESQLTPIPAWGPHGRQRELAHAAGCRPAVRPIAQARCRGCLASGKRSTRTPDEAGVISGGDGCAVATKVAGHLGTRAMRLAARSRRIAASMPASPAPPPRPDDYRSTWHPAEAER
jgi:hypothetical protein